MTQERFSPAVVLVGAVLCLFVLAEVNYPMLAPQSRLAIFSLLGLCLCFGTVPVHPRLAANRALRWVDIGLMGLTLLAWGWVLVQSEPLFARLWVDGQSLGNRAGIETAPDIAAGIIGLVLVLEAARRTLGWALPLLAGTFVAYAWLGASLPGWLMPHRGYSTERIVSQAFLHSQGVFGIALNVMFTYVFLFVLFGAFLQQTGATGFIIDAARRLFRNSSGGPAKVAVLSSGLMGSLSGSAVANTATTGTFTIPMMRSAGFSAVIAGGVEAAASTGGALVPPIMGAGAYMMLEIIDPPVTFLQIIRAAILPAILYYMSLFLIVHFTARRSRASAGDDGLAPPAPLGPLQGAVFGASFVAMLLFLFMGYTAFRAVTLAMAVGFLVSLFSATTRPGVRGLGTIAAKAARDVMPLIAAAACVGIILGVVTLTGIGTRLPSLLVPLAQESLLLALVALMISSLILGMGLPSAVCYLLLATMVGPVLGKLGVVPLAAHLFIFYFGMMSMVTPPVALAAYAAASIAKAPIMRTAMAAFRFALVGFTLPYLFVFRPQLLMLNTDGETAGFIPIVLAFLLALAGIVPFAAAIAGRLFTDLSAGFRSALLLVAALLLLPGPRVDVAGMDVPILNVAGLLLLLALGTMDARRRLRQVPPSVA
ncbi:MAG: TRAP transporter fused permease subunit [Acidobacteria bacterium]|nr:TRAP transporter fused permease subunit [Acidobacteriota bacterium]